MRSCPKARVFFPEGREACPFSLGSQEILEVLRPGLVLLGDNLPPEVPHLGAGAGRSVGAGRVSPWKDLWRRFNSF